MNAHERIKAAQRERERWVIQQVRKAESSKTGDGRPGYLWYPSVGITTIPIYNAIDRLRSRGRIRLTTRHGSIGYKYVPVQ